MKITSMARKRSIQVNEVRLVKDEMYKLGCGHIDNHPILCVLNVFQKRRAFHFKSYCCPEFIMASDSSQVTEQRDKDSFSSVIGNLSFHIPVTKATQTQA